MKRYYLALLVEVAVFYRHVLFMRGYLFPWDFRGVHLPLATFIAASLRRGEMPLWEPYTYCGNPIFANIQAALFYPPVLLATAASNWFGSDSLPRLLAIAVAAQVFFAGVCTFALLRRMGTQPGAAFVGATVYQLGCFFAAQAEHMGAMHGGSWLPLVWLSVVELRRGLRWFWMAVLSLALSMTIFAGLPQVAVAAFGSALALALVGHALACPPRRPYFIRVLIACLWALLLGAIQLIPTAQLTANSVAKYRAEWLKTGGGMKLEALYSLVIPNYWNVFDMSKFHGPSDPTFLYLYCGMLGMALALAAICWKPDRFTRAFTLFTLGATVWMMGDSTPIGRTIFLALPVPIRIGIHPEYTLPVFALCIAVLAGWGAHRWLPSRWQAVAGAIIALDLLLVSSGRPFNTASVAVEPGTTHDSLDGSPELANRLRSLSGAAQPPYRYDTADAPYGWSSVGPILEIPTANGCDPMAPERTIQLRLSFAPGERWGTCYQVVNASSPIVGLANVRYVLSRSTLPLPRVAAIAGFTIYENPRIMPRYFFSPRVQPAANLADAARQLHATDFDPSQTAIVEGAPPSSAAPGDVQVVSYAANAVRLRTHSPRDAFLVAADAWYPGWEATVDGAPTSLYPTDVAFRGLQVPAGDHTIEMRFIPRILYRSAAVSLVALLAAVWALIAGRSTWRQTPASPGGTAAGSTPATP
jgi:Bacterial membrane protein YfhO